MDIIVIELFTIKTIFYYLRNIIKRKEIYYINYTIFGGILIKILKIMNLSPKKITWDNNKVEDESRIKIFTKIKKKEKYKFSSNIINTVLQNIENSQNLDKYFMVYLSLILPNLKIINNKYLPQQILVSISTLDRIFYNRKNKLIFLIPKSFYDDFFKKYGNDRNIEIKFSNNFFYIEKFILGLKKFFLHFSFFQNLIRGQIYNKKNNQIKGSFNRSVVIEDTFQINKPGELLSKCEINNNDIYYVDQYHKLTQHEISDYKKKKINYIHLNKKFKSKEFPVFFVKLENKKYDLKFKINYDVNLLISYLYAQYNFEKIFWKSLFRKLNTKIYLSGIAAHPHTAAAASAINELDGISLGFSISFFEKNDFQQGIDTFNIFFSFSIGLTRLLPQYSNLKHIIKAGYVGDYKFNKAKYNAKKIRDKISKNGAKFVIGFFDQGSSNNNSHDLGHEPSRNGYKFLLTKLIKNEWMGLIIKPKKPKLLKEKLGPVHKLMLEAINTGRCHVYTDHHQLHSKNFENIPAETAYASDICVHDHLISATAGLEAVLVGKPTLLFDYYHYFESTFYKKNLNVVFNDWNKLWEEIKKWKLSENKNDLGSWDNIIDEIDNFRDFKSNERLSKYISDLMVKLNKGSKAIEAINYANEKFINKNNIFF